MKKLRQMIVKIIPDSLYQQIKVLSAMLLVVLAGVCTMSIYYTASANVSNIKMLNNDKMEQMQSKMKEYSESIYDRISTLAYSPSAYGYFTMAEEERSIYVDEITSAFLNTMTLEDDIEQIGMYDEEMNLIAGNEAFWQQVKLPSNSEKNEMEFGTMFVSDYNGHSYYTISFPVFDLSSEGYGTRRGIVLFAMRTVGIDDIMEDMKVTNNSRMYLLDQNENIISSYGDDYRKYFSIDEQKKSYYYIKECKVNKEGWKLVSVIPQKEVMIGTWDLYVDIAMMYIFLLVLLMVMRSFFKKRIVDPIEQMDTFVKNLLDEPGARMEINRKDEIGRLAKSLNWMLDEKEILQNNVQQFQKKMYEMELSKKKIQILAYRNQINPHFLYNTLGCIRAMALYYDKEDIAEITMSLSELFRYGIRGDNVVLVEEELNHVKEYARIIDYRFAGNIRVHIQTDKAVKKKKMIKLLLQPLVENAVFHGVEKNLNGVDVFVNVELTDEGLLRFCVEDNGCGMSEERRGAVLEMLEKKGDDEHAKSIGLLNIYKRLHLFYGEEAKFLLESSSGVGTRVTIITPGQIQEDKNV